MRNHSNENEFDLRENGRADKTHFHMNDFARRLVLTQRQKVTLKWPMQASRVSCIRLERNACWDKKCAPPQEEDKDQTNKTGNLLRKGLVEQKQDDNNSTSVFDA